jgi:hypothetical protein
MTVQENKDLIRRHVEQVYNAQTWTYFWISSTINYAMMASIISNNFSLPSRTLTSLSWT